MERRAIYFGGYKEQGYDKKKKKKKIGSWGKRPFYFQGAES